MKVVTEAKFLGVILDRTLSYSSHVKYLKNKLSHSSGYFKSCRPHRLGGRSKTSTVSISSPYKIQIRLWVHCI